MNVVTKQLARTGLCTLQISPKGLIFLGRSRPEALLPTGPERWGPNPANCGPTNMFFPSAACVMFLVKGSTWLFSRVPRWLAGSSPGNLSAGAFSASRIIVTIISLERELLMVLRPFAEKLNFHQQRKLEILLLLLLIFFYESDFAVSQTPQL